MIDTRVFLKLPLVFKGEVKIYPPTVNEVISSHNFPIFKSIMCMTQEEIEDELTESNGGSPPETLYSPWEYMWLIIQNKHELEVILKEGFEFFLREPVSFLKSAKKIMIGDVQEVLKANPNITIDELTFIEEEEFFDFQNLLRMSIGEKVVEVPDPNMHPKLKRMKALARYRERVKAKKGDGINFSTTLTSLCCMGLGITPLNIGELGYGTVSQLVRTYQEKDKYETEVRSLQAGADPKRLKPKYWIRNIED